MKKQQGQNLQIGAIFASLCTAALVTASAASAAEGAKAAAHAKGGDAEHMCQNNNCKGHSDCTGFGNDSCGGHNTCKGKGSLEAKSKKECEAKKGMWHDKKDAAKKA